MILIPRYKKTAKEAWQYLLKEREYSWDVLSKKNLDRLNNAIKSLDEIIQSDFTPEVGKLHLETFMNNYGDLVASTPERSWKENVEVFLVALIIALGIRAYFLQPFKIPTHSMKPTLYGIFEEQRQGPKPNFIIQTWDALFKGTTYHRVQVKSGGMIQSIQETKLAGFLPIKGTEFIIGGERYWIWASLQELGDAGYNLQVGDTAAPGQEFMNYSIRTGDHIFVNKLAYNFKLPRRGDPFVFTTQGIARIEASLKAQGILGSQYYIKRCVGVGDDTLRVVPPYLYVNGDIQRGYPFERIYSMKDGYNGYTLGGAYLSTALDTYQIPPDHFWAMGDNSAHSLDSRYWGPVPRANLIGSAAFVYWPFGKRWGFIR